MSTYRDASELLGLTLARLGERHPYLDTFFADQQLELLDDLDRPELTLGRALEEERRRRHPDPGEGFAGEIAARLLAFIAEMEEFVAEEEERVESVTILAGQDKEGRAEPLCRVTVQVGEVVCIVGPTGSGKSRLLADIEWVAQGDTPTGRRVLLNGETPPAAWRGSGDRQLVAQLSQNMNFVIDLSVAEFVAMHAESRGVEQVEQTVEQVWRSANALAGEPFAPETPITSLSGGQSRALMIADVALLSRSPIVLIDEIENAGIDRRQALQTLVRQEKIVLMATHDPILALYGGRRLVLKNGAMHAEIVPTEAELRNLDELRAIDARMMELRNRLRRGELLEQI